MDFRITVNETWGAARRAALQVECAQKRLTVLDTSPNVPNSIKTDVYLRVGGGFAAANSMI